MAANSRDDDATGVAAGMRAGSWSRGRRTARRLRGWHEDGHRVRRPHGERRRAGRCTHELHRVHTRPHDLHRDDHNRHFERKRTAPSTTHTASAPAFVHGGQSAGQTPSAEATAAAAVVAAHGYTAADISDYHANQTLRVLIGTRTGAADPYNERAFFFLGNHYLGTDSTEPSASVDVVGQSDTEVTLTYALYRAHDSLCCPSGGLATVHFQLNNGQLVPLDPIPPASSSSGLSRQ